MTDWTVSRRACLAGLAALPFAGCAHAAVGERIGKIERFDAGLDAVIDVDAPIERLATGYKWAEGPVWVKDGGYLLFTDVPSNVIHRWKAGEGASVWMSPSGLAGDVPPEIREAGANGLAIDGAGHLILADSGTRAVARVDLKTKAKTILADKYDGKRFNSCNDVAIGRGGKIYFTDPPYGLRDGDTSKLKELAFNGVFHLSPDGSVGLVDSSLKRPNGVALSPNLGTLYVAMSDPDRPHILAYELAADGTAMDQGRLFYDMKPQLDQKLPGFPDGLKADTAGRLYATGPGGVHVVSPEGKLLGIISTGKATANCAFGEDGKTLFLTSSDMLAKVRLKASGW